MASEIRVKVLTGLIEGGDIAIATTPLAVGLGVVGVQIVAARECTVTTRNPAYMRLLLGVALHVTLEVLLALEATLAAGLLALELHLFDDRWQVFETQSGPKELLLRRLPGWLAVSLDQAIAEDRGELELLLVVSVRKTAHGSIRPRRGTHGYGAVRSRRSVRFEGMNVGRKIRVRGWRRGDRTCTREGLRRRDGLWYQRLL